MDFLNGIEYLLLAMVSLFAVINPFSTVPAFLAITPGDGKIERIRMARIACLVAGVLLALVAIMGQWAFSILGITLPALQIAGGLVLLMIGFDMLRAPELNNRLNPEEHAIAREKDDVAITPLAVPCSAALVRFPPFLCFNPGRKAGSNICFC